MCLLMDLLLREPRSQLRTSFFRHPVSSNAHTFDPREIPSQFLEAEADIPGTRPPMIDSDVWTAS